MDLAYPRSTVPPGRSGPWIIDRYDVAPPPEGTLEVRPHWAVSPPGTYTRLRHGDCVFMTDQRDEWWTQRTAISEACRRGGEILLTGLGLGLVAAAMLETPESRVERIVVVEQSTDVIDLVSPTLVATYGERVQIVEGDAFSWDIPAGARFTVGWHDIWPNPQAPECESEEAELTARFAPYCDWQGTWSAQWRIDEADSVLAIETAAAQSLT